MKKKLFVLVLVLSLLLMTTSTVLAEKPVQTDAYGNEIAWENSNPSCTSIQDGGITDKDGNPITTGYDQYGYNYQAHMFNGYAANYSRPAVLVTSGDKLMMKWSDAWIANVDCNGDGKLDRGLVNGISNGISQGWLTNEYTGWYDSDADGVLDAHYTDFIKIVYTGSGSPLWGSYTVLQEVYNDPVGGYHGVLSKSIAPGFGLNDQWTTIP